MINSPGDLSRSKAVKAHVRTNEVEKEDESRNGGVSRVERTEAAFSLVPSLELTVKRFDEIVGNIVYEALDLDVFSFGKEAFDRDVVGRVTVSDDAARRAKLFSMVQDGVSLRGVTMRGEMKTEHETSLAVDDEPNIVFFAINVDNGFVSVPLIGVEVHGRQELDGDVVEQGREFPAPVSDRSV